MNLFICTSHISKGQLVATVLDSTDVEFRKSIKHFKEI